MKKMLLEFLDAGQLAIGAEDEKLSLLERAATDLRSQLESRRGMIPRVTLTALDANLPASDPIYVLAAAATTTHWKTIFNRQGPEPVQIYRALLLTALQELSAEDEKIRRAILATSALVPVTSFGKGEAIPIRNFLDDLKRIEHEQVENAWVAVPELGVPLLAAKSRRVSSKADLTLAMARAVGPSNKTAQSLECGNPQWPDSGEAWAHVFAEKAAEAIYSAISSSHRVVADEMVEMLRVSLSGVTNAFNKLALRDAKTELLWVKESAYSPSACRRLDQLKGGESILFPVLDVSRIAGTATAESLEWFLYDLVTASSTTKVEVSHVLSEIGTLLQPENEAHLVGMSGLPAQGRRTLLEIALTPEPGADFLSQAGLANGYKESPANLAVRLFRELQALKVLLT